MYSCDGKAEFSAAVFSVTLSFRNISNHSNNHSKKKKELDTYNDFYFKSMCFIELFVHQQLQKMYQNVSKLKNILSSL